jgi:SAM-dependent methyltransferase
MPVRKLNVGCGEFRKDGYVNLDIRTDVGADIVHDLHVFPYPIPDNEFDLVEADHVLEHLNDPFLAMKEFHRITKGGGIVVVRTPHFSRGFSHPEHKRGFDVSFPLYFEPRFKGGYQGVAFELKEVRFAWFAQKYLKRTTLSPFQYRAGASLDVVLSFLANLSPFACARLWCFWVGGFEEIMFRLTVRK